MSSMQKRWRNVDRTSPWCTPLSIHATCSNCPSFTSITPRTSKYNENIMYQIRLNIKYGSYTLSIASWISKYKTKKFSALLSITWLMERRGICLWIIAICGWFGELFLSILNFLRETSFSKTLLRRLSESNNGTYLDLFRSLCKVVLLMTVSRCW